MSRSLASHSLRKVGSAKPWASVGIVGVAGPGVALGMAAGVGATTVGVAVAARAAGDGPTVSVGTPAGGTGAAPQAALAAASSRPAMASSGRARRCVLRSHFTDRLPDDGCLAEGAAEDRTDYCTWLGLGSDRKLSSIASKVCSTGALRSGAAARRSIQPNPFLTKITSVTGYSLPPIFKRWATA